MCVASSKVVEGKTGLALALYSFGTPRRARAVEGGGMEVPKGIRVL